MTMFLIIMSAISFLLTIGEKNSFNKKVYAACFLILSLEIAFIAALPHFTH